MSQTIGVRWSKPDGSKWGRTRKIKIQTGLKTNSGGTLRALDWRAGSGAQRRERAHEPVPAETEEQAAEREREAEDFTDGL